MAHDPYAVLRLVNVRRFLLGRLITVLGEQMLAVAVGWELYSRTKSATVLGLVGLVQVLPIIVLALPAGQAADRFARRGVILVGQSLAIASAVMLALIVGGPASGLIPDVANQAVARFAAALGETDARFDDRDLTAILAVVLTLWTARTFTNAARGPLLAQMVARHELANATTWNSSIFQLASVTGPAVGGVLIHYAGTTAVFVVAGGCMTVYWLAVASLGHLRPLERRGEPPGLAQLMAGLRFVVSTRLLLATITLDLFAVLLGGATALLPMFAERLGVGSLGLGWMQAAPALGAIIAAMVMAHLPPMRAAGNSLLVAVVGFGLATIGLGLSESFPLTLLMLLLTGATDMVSVVVRDTLVQTVTPDHLRGRVSAVNNVFIGTSNQLGAFESGLTAAALGPVASVVLGGVGTIVVVIAAAVIWPEIRRLGALSDLTPPEESPPSPPQPPKLGREATMANPGDTPIP